MKKRKILALVVSISLLAIIFYKINWSELISTFMDFNFRHIVPIVFWYVFTMYLRGVRWKALLMNNPKYDALHLGEVFIVGSMLNIFLPARAGDMYRAYYLGSVKDESKMKVFGSIILERTFDGICVFLILILAVLMYCRQAWILNIAYGIGALFIGSLIAFYILFKFNKIDWVCAKLISVIRHLPQKMSANLEVVINKMNNYMNSFMKGFEVLDNPKLSIIAFVSSIAIWGIECYVAFLILESFSLGLGFAAALFVLSLISFSTMLPSTSVFLGPYQYAYILALGIFNINKSTALAVSTVHQGILMIILTVLGMFFLCQFNISMKDIKNAAD